MTTMSSEPKTLTVLVGTIIGTAIAMTTVIPYNALRTTLKAEIDEDAWATLHSGTSRPFARPESGRIAVKVINHLGDEVMKVFSA